MTRRKGRDRPKQKTIANSSSNNTQESQTKHSPNSAAIIPSETDKQSRCCKAENAQGHQADELNRALIKWTKGLVFVGAITAGILIIHGWIFYETDETSRASNRAFVAVRDISSTAVGSAQNGNDISYNITTVWENSGNTETRDLQIGGALLQVPVGSHPIPPLWSPSGDASSYILLPKATLPNFTLSMAGSDVNKIRDIKSFIYIFGFAKYEDAFGKHHLTLACSRLFAGQVDYTKAGASGIGGLQCGEYNCADKECLRYKTGPFAATKLTELLKYIE